jgi:hypothetical protein
MATPRFLFTEYPNSFSVHVENLENLRVDQIQEIQAFVSARKGVFDFGTYTFVIQKRINFENFCSLLEHLGIEATSQENILESEFEPRVGFGKYKGLTYTDIPEHYLLWLKRNYHGAQKEYIDAEIKRRKL